MFRVFFPNHMKSSGCCDTWKIFILRHTVTTFSFIVFSVSYLFHSSESAVLITIDRMMWRVARIWKSWASSASDFFPFKMDFREKFSIDDNNNFSKDIWVTPWCFWCSLYDMLDTCIGWCDFVRSHQPNDNNDDMVYTILTWIHYFVTCFQFSHFDKLIFTWLQIFSSSNHRQHGQGSNNSPLRHQHDLELKNETISIFIVTKLECDLRNMILCNF